MATATAEVERERVGEREKEVKKMKIFGLGVSTKKSQDVGKAPKPSSFLNFFINLFEIKMSFLYQIQKQK